MTDKPNYVVGTFWIIASLAFAIYWLLHLKPQIVHRNNLKEVSGTIKTLPRRDAGAKGSIGARFELNEYANTVFGIGSGLYSVIDRHLFKDAKINDSVFFFIDKELYIKRLAQPYDDNFINNFPYGKHIPFYDLTIHGKNYLAIDDFNKKQIKENLLRNIFCAAFLLLLLTQVYTFVKNQKSQQST